MVCAQTECTPKTESSALQHGDIGNFLLIPRARLGSNLAQDFQPCGWRDCSLTVRLKTPAPLTQEELDELINNFKPEIVEPTIDTAKQLLLKLEEYKNVIKTSAETRQVYTICRYVQELASEFHSFYNSNRVICDDKELMKSRIALVWAVKTVLRTAMEDILGVTAPQSM